MSLRNQAAPLLANSCRAHARASRAQATRARKAYSNPGPLRDAALLLADAHDECSAVWERAMAQWEAAHGPVSLPKKEGTTK